MKKGLLRCFLIGLFFSCKFCNVFAVARTWVGGTIGGTTAWNLASNWSPAAIPNGADNLSIGATANQPTITGTAGACKSLTITGNVTITLAADLAVSNGISTTGQYVLNIAGTKAMTVNGPVSFNFNSSINIGTNATVNFTSATIDMTNGNANCNITNNGHLNFTTTTLTYGFQTSVTNNLGGVATATATTFNLNNNEATINNAGTFTVNGASTITLGNTKAQIINSGTFYAGTTNNSSCTINLNNQPANNGTGANIYNTGNFSLGSTSVINFSSGAVGTTINNTGTFTIQSDQYGTGSIGQLYAVIPVQSVIGIYNVERYFTATRGWRLMSSPVNNSSTIPVTAAAAYNFSSLKTNLLVTGPAGGSFDPSSIALTILLYTTSTGLFTGPTNITNTNNVGQGFYFYFRGNSTTNVPNKVARMAGVYATPEAVAGLQSGTLNQGPFTYTLSNTVTGTGYNLVGNPYPSSITVTAAALLTNTNGTVYTFAPAGNSITANTLPVTIASGEGFFVKSTNAPAASSVAFTEALKTSAQVNNAFAVILPDTLITMQMIQDTANYNITKLRFSDLYSKNYNEMEDADVLNGVGQTVFLGAMTADGHQVAIASQPLNKQNTSVFLSVDDNSSGTYSLKRMNLTAIPGYYDVWLMDHFKNDSLDLRSNDTYAFNLDKNNAATYGNKRFEIAIRKKALPPYQLLTFNGKHTNLENTLQWNTANEYTYTTFEVQYSTNNKDFNTISSMQSTGSGSYNFTDASSATGYYRLKQTDVNKTVSYSNIVIIGAPGIFTVYPNPAANTLQFNTTETVKTTVQLKIYNSIGLLVQSAAFNTGTGRQNVSALTTGIYTVQLIDNYNNKTIASTKFIKQ